MNLFIISNRETPNHKRQGSFLSDLPGEKISIRHIGVGTAIAASGALSAGTSLLAREPSGTSRSAPAYWQWKAARKAARTQLEMFETGREDLAPWREAGANALENLYGPGGLIEQGPGEFVPEDQPGYKFGFEEFIRKPQGQAAAATGQRLSGQTARDLTRYASDYASTGYDNFLNRYYKSLEPYQQASSAGQAAAAGSAQLGVSAAPGISQAIQAGGIAKGAGVTSGADFYNQQLAGIAGAGQNALQNYMDLQILKKIGGGGNALNRFSPVNPGQQTLGNDPYAFDRYA